MPKRTDMPQPIACKGEHISAEAREYLSAASPVPDGNPRTPEDWQKYRAPVEAEATRLADEFQSKWGFHLEPDSVAGVPVIRITPPDFRPQNRRSLVIYVHGGAYTVTNARQTAWVAAGVVRHLGVRALAIDYRFAPEFPFPCGLDDTVGVYGALADRFRPEHLAIVGDSAGGGLCLATVLRARDEGIPMPAAVGLFSPWADIDRIGDTYSTLEGIDAQLHYDLNLRRSKEAYVGSHDPKHPYISPIYADFTRGFPSTLIMSGTRDLFLSNCARLHEALRLAGQHAELIVREAMDHGLGIWPPLPEGDDTFRSMANFVAGRLGAGADVDSRPA